MTMPKKNEDRRERTIAESARLPFERSDAESEAAEEAHEEAKTVSHLFDLLRRLMDAAEAYLTSEPDMPSHDSTVEELEGAIAAAHAVLDLPDEPSYER